MLLNLLLGFALLQVFMKSWAIARLHDVLRAAQDRGEDMQLLRVRLEQGPKECYRVCGERGDPWTPWIMLLAAMLSTPARYIFIGATAYLLFLRLA